MAKKETTTKKEPGRIAQLRQVFTMTVKADSQAIWWMLLGFAAPVAVGIVVALLLRGFWLATVGWIVLGIVTGVLIAMIILGRRAERVAYAQIEGQPGAVGAVIRSSLRRGWSGSEMPVSVNPRTQDAIYRVVGRAGVVLLLEGRRHSTKMVHDERTKISRVVPNVPITVLDIGTGSEQVRLQAISRRLGKLKPVLTRAEVAAVNNRLSSLETAGGLSIPKGIDPTRVRPDHRAVRGR